MDAAGLLIAFLFPEDVEIKLDEEGFVLPASHVDEVYKRLMVSCIRRQGLIVLQVKELDVHATFNTF